MTAFQKIQSLISQQSTDSLKEMYRDILTQGTEIETLVVRGALECELEDRGVIRFNEDTFEYEEV